MPGVKTAGWAHLQNAMEVMVDAQNENLGETYSGATMLSHLADGVSGVAYGSERSFQELYERMERLHQKIDRIERKIGSIPGSK